MSGPDDKAAVRLLRRARDGAKVALECVGHPDHIDYFTELLADLEAAIAIASATAGEQPDLSGTNFRMPPQEIFEAARAVVRWFAGNNIKDYAIAGIGPRSPAPAAPTPDSGEPVAWWESHPHRIGLKFSAMATKLKELGAMEPRWSITEDESCWLMEARAALQAPAGKEFHHECVHCGRDQLVAVPERFRDPALPAPTFVGVDLAREVMRDVARLDWLEENGSDRFVRYESKAPEQRWFDTLTKGSDWSPTLRAAIDAARKAKP